VSYGANPPSLRRFRERRVRFFSHIMRAHLHLLGILQLVWGAIGLLLGASMLLLAMGAIAIGVTSGADRMAAGITAGAFAIFAIVLLAGGGANLWAGRALRRNRPHGRLAVLWLGALNLFVLPFGTALGIYAFWVLLHARSRAVFVAQP
jgi:predicted lysophospholipase L1 biosynthesis ABC-type transport system permease subunit